MVTPLLAQRTLDALDRLLDHYHKSLREALVNQLPRRREDAEQIVFEHTLDVVEEVFKLIWDETPLVMVPTYSVCDQPWLEIRDAVEAGRIALLAVVRDHVAYWRADAAKHGTSA